MYQQNFVSFQLAAADLNLVAKVDKVVAELPVNSNVVYIPRRIELFKEAGTAYTLSPVLLPTVGGQVAIDAFDEEARPRLSSYSDLFGGDRFLNFSLGYIGDSSGIAYAGRPFFFVPVVGFLDQATTQQRIAVSIIDGGIFKPGRFKLVVSASIGIAGGTGDLYGRMYYDMYPVMSSGFFHA